MFFTLGWQKTQEISTQYHIDITSQLSEQIYRIVVEDSFAYMTGEQGFQVLEIQNSAFPSVVGTLPDYAGYELVVEGNYVYMITGYHLLIVDISNPTQPNLVGMYSEFEPYVSPGGFVYYPITSGLAVRSGVAYVSLSYAKRCDRYGRLAVLDVSNPAGPVRVGTVAMPYGIGDNSIAGNFGYVLSDISLVPIDLTIPFQPVPITHFPLNKYAYHVGSNLVVEGKYAFISHQEYFDPCTVAFANWQIVNISDPFDPVILANYTNETRLIYAFNDGYLYTWQDQLEVITLNEHHIPIAAFSDDFFDLDTANGFMYVVDGDTLTTMRLSAVSQLISPSLNHTVVHTDTNGLETRFELEAQSVLTPTQLSYLPLPTVDTPLLSAYGCCAFDLAAYVLEEQVTLQTFERSVTVTLQYDDGELPEPGLEDELKLFYWNGEAWEDAAESCTPASIYQYDLVNNLISLPICQLGKYGLFARPYQAFLPLIHR